MMMDIDEGGSQGSAEGKKFTGLHFPVKKVARLLVSQKYAMSRRYPECYYYHASVYLSAVLQYLAAEVLELAAKAAKDDNRTRIASCDIESVASNDEELNKLLSQVLELAKDIPGDICKDLTIMMGQVTMKN